MVNFLLTNSLYIFLLLFFKKNLHPETEIQNGIESHIS